MTPAVAAALDEMSTEHGPDLSADARRAWADLTDDGGPENVSQYSLQVYCWAVVVRSVDEPAERVRRLQALAQLLRRIGLLRYADIAWGEGSRELLRAARQDRDGGRSTYDRLMAQSGVLPADTDLLTWGTAYGELEAGMIRRVADTLELAAIAGEVDPGHRSSGRQRRAVTRGVLLAATPEAADAPTLSWVLAERADLWAGAGHSPTRRQLMNSLVDRVVSAEPLTDGVDLTEALARLRWLVDRCRDSERLTAAGYLAPATVRAFHHDHPSPWVRPPFTESQHPGLRYTRSLATELGLLRERKGTVSATKQAAQANSAPAFAALVARRLLARGAWGVEMQAREVVVACCLTGSLDTETMISTVAAVLNEMGWRLTDGQPLEVQDVNQMALEPYRELLHAGWLDDDIDTGPHHLVPGATELLLESMRQLLAHRDPREFLSVGD